MSRQAVAKWESGRGFPDLNNIKNISSIFNVGIDELLDYKAEEINLEIDAKKEVIDKNNSKFSKVNQFFIEKFKNADSIEMLTREKNLTFWQNIFELFFTPVPGTIEIVELIGNGLVYSFLVKEKGNIYLVLINKTIMITKKLKQDFDKNIIIDGYKYTKFKNNKIK